MLLDRASALADKITSYQTFREAAEKAGEVETRAQQFGNCSMLIGGLRDTFDSLADAGISVDFSPKDGGGLADNARKLRDEVKVNPATLKDPPFDLKHGFNDRLNGIARAGREAALAAWKAHVNARAAFGADDVLSALDQVAQFKPHVLKIRRIRSEVAGLGENLPSSPKPALKVLDALVAEHKKAWTALDAADIPTSVVAFIRDAARSEATLDSFTPEVKSWVEDRNLLGAFRIKLS